jgi:hypothetical protein
MEGGKPVSALRGNWAYSLKFGVGADHTDRLAKGWFFYAEQSVWGILKQGRISREALKLLLKLCFGLGD